MIELVIVSPKQCQVYPVRDREHALEEAGRHPNQDAFVAVDGLVTEWRKRFGWQPIEVDTITDEYAAMARLAVDPLDPWTVAAVAVHRVTCAGCDKQFRSFEVEGSTQLCEPCYEEGGLENEHSDYGHPDPVANCPACRAEATA